MLRLLAGVVICVASSFASGCALRTVGQGSNSVPTGPEGAAPALEAHIEKARYLSARPAAKSSGLATIEQQDRPLASALLDLAVAPTGERHRVVAERYRTLGVSDVAYEHFGRAVALNSRDAAAHDGLARVWRDWGYPHLALSDAYRAVFYAPTSAAARNTMGTVFQALGRHVEARRAYEEAVKLEPRAVYALSNLCYLSFLQGQFDDATRVCRLALTLDPSYRAARNNLGLAHAAAGRFDLARIEFMDTGDDAFAQFNIGIVHMALREYGQAAHAFDAASRRNPTMVIARDRANQARQLQRRTAREKLGDPK